jgi:hypothetical protein
LHSVPTEGEPANGEQKEWARAVDGAIASASHPLAFAATLLDCDPVLYRGRVTTGLDDAERLRLWYTDGGLVDNEPLGRALGNLQAGRRLVLVVRSDARGAPDKHDPAWTGAVTPRWTETLMRSLDILTAHAAGEGVRQAEKINSRLTWIETAARCLEQQLPDDDETKRAVNEALAGVREEQRAMKRDPSPAADDAPEQELGQALRELLLIASGLQDKQPLDVAVVTNDPDVPLRVRDVRLQVGGFLDRRRREYDFAAGYWRMLSWLDGSADRPDLGDAELASHAIDAAKAERQRPRDGRWARRRMGRISPLDRLRVVGLGLRYFRIMAGDAVAIRRGRRKQARDEALRLRRRGGR